MKTLSSLVLLLSLVSAAAADLGPGDPAPKLSIKTWIKGEPVASLAKDKTYVVEFWATWCGPCIESMPHLTELAHKYKDVTFIGVSVWENDDDHSVERFVQEHGATMDYHVAYSGNQDGMSKTWLRPADQEGIPASFIVKNGVIQWIGHPMELAAPLAQVTAGKFDLDGFKAQYGERAKKARQSIAMNQELVGLDAIHAKGKFQEAKDGLNRFLAKYPQSKAEVSLILFQWLASEDSNACVAEAKKKISTGKKEDLLAILSLANREAATTKGNHKLARTLIDLVLDSNPKPDLQVLQYSVYVFGSLADYPKAIEYVDKVLASVPDIPENAELRKFMIGKKASFEASAKQSH